ncbi:MAG: nucleotide sugar dehydrogenase [Pseudomonadota bacterium]
MPEQEADSVLESSAGRSLAEKIAGRDAVVAVLGLGYVGLPLALAFNCGGFSVLGFDIDPEKLAALTAGRSYFKHIPDQRIGDALLSGRFAVTGDYSALTEADVLIICVPTPLAKNREPDLSFVEETCLALTPHLRAGQMIVLESTTYPGTTQEVVRPLLAQSDLAIDQDIFLAYSPEREDPGNPNFETTSIPKVIGADSDGALFLANSLYRQVIPQTVPVSSTATAEAVKLTENIFRAINIALVNELKVIYSAMGLNIWEVIEAAKTKPFGYMPFYPGPGLGGHCIPIDPFYLTWRAQKEGISTRFIELAGEINAVMPGYVISILEQALKERRSLSLERARILVLGMAYKKNVDDTRESPALEILDQLLKRGAQVDYHDPFVPAIPKTRKYPHLTGKESRSLSAKCLREFEAILVCTDHDTVDYEMIKEHAELIIDSRNCVPTGSNVVGA